MAARSKYLRQRNGASASSTLHAQREVARDRPRLDQRRALPVLAEALVIGQRRRHGDGDCPGARLRPQPQVDAQHVAVGGRRLQQAHEVAHEAHVERLHAVAVAHRGLAGIVEADEVDVARVVELGAAELAQREHDEAAALLGVVAVECEAAGRRGAAEEEGEGGSDEGFGGSRQGADHVLEHPGAAEIGQRHRQATLWRARRRPRIRAASSPASGESAERRERGVDDLVRVAIEDRQEARRIRLDQAPEKGRVIGDAGQKRAHRPRRQGLARGGLQCRLEIGEAPARAALVGDARVRLEELPQRTGRRFGRRVHLAITGARLHDVKPGVSYASSAAGKMTCLRKLDFGRLVKPRTRRPTSRRLRLPPANRLDLACP